MPAAITLTTQPAHASKAGKTDRAGAAESQNPLLVFVPT